MRARLLTALCLVAAAVSVAASVSVADGNRTADDGFTDDVYHSDGIRVVKPFFGPVAVRGGFGVQLSVGDARRVARQQGAEGAADGGDGAEAMVAARVAPSRLIRASEALNSPLGREIAKRFKRESEERLLPVFQRGFVMSITDLALAACVLKDATDNPSAWRLPREDDDQSQKRLGPKGSLLADINAQPPRGLFAWSTEELVRRWLTVLLSLSNLRRPEGPSFAARCDR